MFKKFIERPVLATVISILLLILGLLSMTKLPVTQFPEIAPPSVFVTAVYPGANAETVARTVAPSLEDAINGVENMTYIKSTSSNDGSLSLQVYFKLGTDPDQAAVNVQNRVSQAISQLPTEVVQIGVTTQKQQNSMIMFMSIYDESKNYDAAFVENYAKINVIPVLKRVTGVGNVTVFGNKDYAMRIWLNPEQMASYGLTPQEVMAAIQDQNVEAAPGKFGEGSKEAFEYVLKYKGKSNQPLGFEEMIIRANADGSVLRVKDVAKVEFGSYTYSGDTWVNGKFGAGMAIYQTAGSNANKVQEDINEAMLKLSKTFPKGLKYETPLSTKVQLDQSISQVIHTLIEAFILVFIVVFIFLQDFRSTLIPAIAVPVAIIGTFFFMQLFGFSINLLTLFALVLAIGIVVDDAIVVVEAVHAKMEHEHLAAKPATLSAMHDITGAVISITLVMAAVFLPVGFMEGPTGVFYRQFAFTLAIAIVISAVNALTLSPALCALFLKNNHTAPAQKTKFSDRFFTAFNTGFSAMTDRYIKSIKVLIRFKWASFGALALLMLLTFWMLRTTPKGFIPDEDGSFIVFSLSMPAGSSLDRTGKALKKADSIIKTIPAAEGVTSISGYDMLSSATSPSFGVGFIKLKDLDKRGEVKNINEIIGVMNQKLSTILEGSIFVFTMPTVPGFGNVSGLEFVLQDRTGARLDKFSEIAQGFTRELMKRKEIEAAFTTFRTDYPQLEMEVDAVKAKQLGVSIKELMGVMQAYYGSIQTSDFNRFGKYYRVVVQANVASRATPESMNGIFVKNNSGQMVPVNTLIKLKRVYGPETVARYNLFNAISINAMAKAGFSTGDAIKATEEVAAKYLPEGYSYEWTGMSLEEKTSGGQAATVFGLCLLFVYFLLAAQYESYILPLAVILSVPVGILGVLLAVNMAGLENNIYVQVAMVMLIGLLAKNAILIIEYAVQRRKAGMTLLDSALEASKLRLRPIIMTSLAFIVGLIPLMRAVGPSALGNRSIGTGAAGGMVLGVILGVFIIPVLYVAFQYLHEKISGKPAAIES